MNPVLAVPTSASTLSALNGLPTAAAVAALCVGVILEILVVPGILLPGGTMTMLAGALIGLGRPSLAVAVPMIIAVLAADQLAYLGGAALVRWWQRRRAGRQPDEVPGDRYARRGQAAIAMWLTAAMPSVAGAMHMQWRPFAVRMFIMRLPWLAAAFSLGTLAARSVTQIGHIAGLIGVVASALVVLGFLFIRHRREVTRLLARTVALAKRKPSPCR